MPPLTTTINGFQVQATPNAQPSASQNTPTQVPAPQTIQPRVENVIPLQSIETPRLNLPEQQFAGLPPLTNFADQILRQSQVQETDAQKAANTISERIFSALPQLTGQREALAQEQERAGVNRFRQELQDINSQILQKTAELNQDDIRLIQSTQEIEKQKIPIEFITGQQQSVQRDAQIARALKASEIGVLNARALATQGNIQLAMDIAQQAVDVKYAPLKETVEVYKAQLEALQPILSRDEKRQSREQEVRANLALKEIERLQQNEKGVQDLIINASSQQAPQELLVKASKAKNPTEASIILGGYSGDYIGNKIKIAQANAQAQKTNLEIQKLRRELSQSTATPSVGNLPNTPTGFTQKLLLTANKDKQLDATERNQLSKMTSVISQIDSLQANLAKNNKTGFIQGRVNKLLTEINLNPDVSEINAQITALIPNVARGVYGEVGVLTDADIENYRGTLAKLTNSKDQNDAVLALTLKNAMKSYESVLNTAANSGINVSGWAEDYNAIASKVYEIEDRIGVSKKAVQNLAVKDPNLQPVIEEMYKAGLTDGDILTALNAR